MLVRKNNSSVETGQLSQASKIFLTSWGWMWGRTKTKEWREKRRRELGWRGQADKAKHCSATVGHLPLSRSQVGAGNCHCLNPVSLRGSPPSRSPWPSAGMTPSYSSNLDNCTLKTSQRIRSPREGGWGPGRFMGVKSESSRLCKCRVWWESAAGLPWVGRAVQHTFSRILGAPTCPLANKQRRDCVAF